MGELDRHGLPIIRFDGTNAEVVAAAELASFEACRCRSCEGCPATCSALSPSPKKKDA